MNHLLGTGVQTKTLCFGGGERHTLFGLQVFCDFNGFEPCRVWRRIEKEQDTKLEAETDAIIHGLGC